MNFADINVNKSRIYPNMEENRNGINVTVHIINSNATIAPVAKVAGQTIINVGTPDQVQDALVTAETLNLKLAEMSQEPEIPQQSVPFDESDDAIRLRKYCDTEESWKKYLDDIRTSKSATDLAKVIVMMEQSEENLMRDDSTKQSFLEVVQPLAIGIKKGNTISNIRQRIYDAQRRNKNKK